MYCPNCGHEVFENAAVCLNCGASVEKIRKKTTEEKPGAGWWWLGFFIPLAGFLIWALCSDTPKKAKKAGMGALTGTILSIVFAVLIYIAYFALIFWAVSEPDIATYYTNFI